MIIKEAGELTTVSGQSIVRGSIREQENLQQHQGRYLQQYQYHEGKYLGVWPQLAIESQYMNGVHPVCLANRSHRLTHINLNVLERE